MFQFTDSAKLFSAATLPKPDPMARPVVGLGLGVFHWLAGPQALIQALAMIGAAQAKHDPVVWVMASHGDQRADWLNPQGIAAWFCPSRLVVVAAPDLRQQYLATEDCLRAGVITLLTIEHPPALTPKRRLHLAARSRGQPERDHAQRS